MRHISNPQANPQARKLLTRHELADALGVHYNTVYRYVRDGRIPAVKIGHAVRFDWPQVARALGLDDEGGRNE